MNDMIQKIERDAAATTVHLSGEIDLHQSPRMHEELVTLCAEKPTRLILNLSAVTYIDSSGVGSLVEIYRRVKRHGGQFILVAPNPRVMSVLEITRLDHFFTIVETQEEALQK